MRLASVAETLLKSGYPKSLSAPQVLTSPQTSHCPLHCPKTGLIAVLDRWAAIHPQVVQT